MTKIFFYIITIAVHYLLTSNKTPNKYNKYNPQKEKNIETNISLNTNNKFNNDTITEPLDTISSNDLIYLYSNTRSFISSLDDCNLILLLIHSNIEDEIFKLFTTQHFGNIHNTQDHTKVEFYESINNANDMIDAKELIEKVRYILNLLTKIHRFNKSKIISNKNRICKSFTDVIIVNILNKHIKLSKENYVLNNHSKNYTLKRLYKKHINRFTYLFDILTISEILIYKKFNSSGLNNIYTKKIKHCICFIDNLLEITKLLQIDSYFYNIYNLHIETLKEIENIKQFLIDCGKEKKKKKDNFREISEYELLQLNKRLFELIRNIIILFDFNNPNNNNYYNNNEFYMTLELLINIIKQYEDYFSLVNALLTTKDESLANIKVGLRYILTLLGDSVSYNEGNADLVVSLRDLYDEVDILINQFKISMKILIRKNFYWLGYLQLLTNDDLILNNKTKFTIYNNIKEIDSILNYEYKEKNGNNMTKKEHEIRQNLELDFIDECK